MPHYLLLMADHDPKSGTPETAEDAPRTRFTDPKGPGPILRIILAPIQWIGCGVYRFVARPAYLPNGEALGRAIGKRANHVRIKVSPYVVRIDSGEQTARGWLMISVALLVITFATAGLLPEVQGPARSPEQKAFMALFAITWISGAASIWYIVFGTNTSAHVYEPEVDGEPDKPLGASQKTYQRPIEEPPTAFEVEVFEHADEEPQEVQLDKADPLVTHSDHRPRDPFSWIFHKWEQPEYLEGGLAIFVSTELGAAGNPWRFAAPEQQRAFGFFFVLSGLGALGLAAMVLLHILDMISLQNAFFMFLGSGFVLVQGVNRFFEIRGKLHGQPIDY